MTALNAGWAAWQEQNGSTLTPTMADLYALRWRLYDGSAFDKAWKAQRQRLPYRIYANARLVYKHCTSVVDFYGTTVYAGDLSTDGQPLPDGTKGAIPIDPQVGGNTEAETNLRRGIAELWSAWNWRQMMTLRPMYGAALGDILTELIDDTARGIVYPAHIWPGYVTNIELDFVGNVKAYRLEYMVTEERDDGRAETYQYAKEVDKETFRYFKNDRPFDYYGEGAEVDNPYGFVPAIWDRHQIGWGERGIAATDSTRAALFELNGFFSHAIDGQQRIFAAPIVVKGRITKPGQTVVQVRQPPQTSDDATALAENINYLEGDANADLVQPTIDITQALAAIEHIKQGILEENPEASFYSELRKMSQVTAPGAERILGDAVARCKRARSGYDANTIKLFQMALAMAGFRYAQGNSGWGKRTARQKAWAPFGLTSYAAGLLDFGITDRPVIPETPEERLALITQRESIQTQWGLEESGVDPEDAKAIIKQKQDAATLGQF